MKIKLSLVAAFIAVICVGCSGTAKLAEALSKDNAIISTRTTTPWGSTSLVRANPGTNQTARVSADGTIVIGEK